MQDRPSKEVLLDAVAMFLLEKIRPAISDPALSFRVLIAANLASIAATEIRTESDQNAAELGRLKDLLGRDGSIPELNKALAINLRRGIFDGDGLIRATAHVKQTLVEKLAVNNPRFETAMDIES